MHKPFHQSPWLWALVAALAGIALSLVPQWQLLERKGYDLLTLLSAPDTTGLPIVIVGIDEPSFADLGLRWPWHRGLHAALVDQLNRGGAAVIAFDIIFADPSDPEQDRRFARSIERAGNVLLAGDVSYLQTAQFEQLMRVYPLGQFLDAGATTGITRIDIDADLVVRTLPQAAESLWREIIRLHQAGRSGPDLPAGGMVRYWRPDPGFRYVSYYQALNADSMLPPGFFQDKIVLIGLYLEASPDPNSAGTDTFATPYLHSTGSLTPGVAVHANFVADGLTNRFIVDVPLWGGWLVTLGTVLLANLGMGAWRPVRSLLPVLGLSAALTGADFWLFTARDLWLPVGSSLLALVLLYLLRGAIAFLGEVQLRKAIRRSFEHYVAPALVKRLVESPEALRLGGESREMTFLFTDIAGFTTFTEASRPEQLVTLLNEYLERMCGIVMAHGGTIDKIVGDAIHAIFNAPLDQPDHAARAVACALELDRVGQEFARRHSAGGPAFGQTRIGVNTGIAIVGNFGGIQRFDYTAHGDSINTAARLESVNKHLGTRICVSASTAAQCPRQTFRPIAVLVLKGKTHGVETFLPVPEGGVDETLLKGYGQFYDRLRRGDPAARDTLKKLRRAFPDDPLLAFHAGRMAQGKLGVEIVMGEK